MVGTPVKMDSNAGTSRTRKRVRFKSVGIDNQQPDTPNLRYNLTPERSTKRLTRSLSNIPDYDRPCSTPHANERRYSNTGTSRTKNRVRFKSVGKDNQQPHTPNLPYNRTPKRKSSMERHTRSLSNIPDYDRAGSHLMQMRGFDTSQVLRGRKEIPYIKNRNDSDYRTGFLLLEQDQSLLVSILHAELTLVTTCGPNLDNHRNNQTKETAASSNQSESESLAPPSEKTLNFSLGSATTCTAGVDIETHEPKLIMVKYANNLKEKIAEISQKFKDDIRIKIAEKHLKIFPKNSDNLRAITKYLNECKL
ncbi:hypothetical protein CEXT_365221 [Caerostris extrusa]|uniref:Uncharacterized protein n=1 Tax=Caerostris extrusa TaxID=172846 RepID=A0AAV4QAA2_CAEEX|nr:hypothetical protein CEXT_365221 [Caerostris extrusa]